MGKLLILSVTNGEEQILDRIKDFLAEEPGIEVVEPPAAKHTLTIPGLELHLRKQTVKWQGQPLHLTHLEFFTLAYLARHPGWILHRSRFTRPYGTSSRRTAARPWSTSSASSAGRWDRETRSVPSPTAATSSSCLLRIRCAGKSKFNNLCRLIAIYLKENEQRVRACKYHLFLLSCQCEQIGIAVIPAVPIPMSTGYRFVRIIAQNLEIMIARR